MERKGEPTLIRAGPPGWCVARICPSRRSGKTVAANKTAVASTWYIFPYNFRHSVLSEVLQSRFKASELLLPESFANRYSLDRSRVSWKRKKVARGYASVQAFAPSQTNLGLISLARPEYPTISCRPRHAFAWHNDLANPLLASDTSGRLRGNFIHKSSCYGKPADVISPARRLRISGSSM